MTRIVALGGSPNKLNGYSGALLKSMIDGARAAGAVCELHHLYDYEILPCRGCYSCSRRGKCPLKDKDDQQLLEDALVRADGLILATPNYMNGVTAKMKLFFDRSFSRLYHCQMLRKKPVAAVISSGGPLFEAVENYLHNVVVDMYCGWMVGVAGAPERVLEDPEMRSEMLASAFALGVRLVEAIEQGEAFPGQEENHDRTFEVIRYLVTTHEQFSFEKQYWIEHFGLEPDGADIGG